MSLLRVYAYFADHHTWHCLLFSPHSGRYQFFHAQSASGCTFGSGMSFLCSAFRLLSIPNLRSLSPIDSSHPNCPSAVKLVISFGSPRGRSWPWSTCLNSYRVYVSHCLSLIL